MARPKNKNNVWLIDKFYGGIADGSKRGYRGAFRTGQGLDYRTDPDILTSLRKLTKDSGSTITDLPKWILRHDGETWVYGDTGKIYKEASNGTWSNPKTVSDSHGNGMAVFNDYLYYASDSGLGRYGPLSGTPAWNDDFLVGADEVSSSQLISGSNYALTTGITETSAHKITWTATGNLRAVVLYPYPNVTTGDLTIEVHDSSNNVVGKQVVENADLPGTGAWEIQFSNPVKLTVGNSYHLHVYSSVADGELLSGTSNNLSTAFYAIYDNVSVEDIDVSAEVDLTAGGISGANSSYDLLTSLSEGNDDKREFIPDKHNITAVSVQLYDADAATYTVKIHDEEDNEVGSGTYVISSDEGVGFRRVDLTSTVSVVPGATYHIHLYINSGSPTALTSENDSMSGLGYKIHYQVLDTDTDWHPMMFYPNASALVIGNGRHLAVYDGITYRTSGQRDGSERLTFAQEEKVRALDIVGDYLSIGTWKGDSIGDNARSNLYMWDGTSAFINAFKPITGEINATKTGDDGLLHIWHGGFGHMSIFDGGLTLVKTIPNVGENKYVEIYPGAVTTHNGVVKFGISDGDSTTVKRCLYSYGRINKDYPFSLNIDAPISTGTTDNNVQIGAVLGAGPARLYVGWKDDTSYGVDVIDTSNDQTTTSFETLIFDGDEPHFEKLAKTVKVTYEALESGQSIKVYYKIDRASSWTELGTASTVGSNTANFSFINKRFKEIELKIELITTGTEGPKIISIATFFDYISDIQE